jgi:hypothetical protein
MPDRKSVLDDYEFIRSKMEEQRKEREKGIQNTGNETVTSSNTVANTVYDDNDDWFSEYGFSGSSTNNGWTGVPKDYFKDADTAGPSHRDPQWDEERDVPWDDRDFRGV